VASLTRTSSLSGWSPTSLMSNAVQSRSGRSCWHGVWLKCIEPPTAGRVDRIVRSALHRGEELLVGRVVARLPLVVRSRLLDLLAAESGGEESARGLASIRSEPGNVSLNTMLTEIAKLRAVRAVELPGDVFADVAPKVIAAWRARAAVEAPSHRASIHSG
jgi:hypothetical protein